MSNWPEHAIWWHIYPLGFVDAEADALPAGQPVIHRLPQLIGWLDYAVELGCSGIQLGPIFESESHGYDTIDHLRIDPRLGDGADFDQLIAACQQRGLHVLLDGVFNHVSRDFGRFQAALRDGPGSPSAGWFHLRWPDGAPGAQPEYDNFEGHDNLVTFNHDEPEVASYVTEVMAHWCDRGISGWRLDAAYALPPAFWQAVVPPVRQRHPESWFVGEVIPGDYVDYVTQSGLDSVTQYELWKALWSSFNDRNLYELAWAFDRHNGFTDRFLPLTFVGNHDATRIASQLSEPQLLGHALVVLFTVAGSPSIYYGDEQALQGVKEERFGGDDAVRPAFPSGPQDLAPFGWPTYQLHQELIALRRRHHWLSTCRVEVLHLANEQLAYRCAPSEGSPDYGSVKITVLLNLAESGFSFPVEASGPIEASSHPGGEDDRLSLAALGWTIIAG